jgi:hypothetical protein
MKITTDTFVEITNVSNGKKENASIGMFKENEVLEVFIVGNRILMKYKPSANMYIGSIYGIEFQSKGPKVDEIKDFRS